MIRARKEDFDFFRLKQDEKKIRQIALSVTAVVVFLFFARRRKKNQDRRYHKSFIEF